MKAAALFRVTSVNAAISQRSLVMLAGSMGDALYYFGVGAASQIFNLLPNPLFARPIFLNVHGWQ